MDDLQERIDRNVKFYLRKMGGGVVYDEDGKHLLTKWPEDPEAEQALSTAVREAIDEHPPPTALAKFVRRKWKDAWRIAEPGLTTDDNGNLVLTKEVAEDHLLLPTIMAIWESGLRADVTRRRCPVIESYGATQDIIAACGKEVRTRGKEIMHHSRSVATVPHMTEDELRSVVKAATRLTTKRVLRWAVAERQRRYCAGDADQQILIQGEGESALSVLVRQLGLDPKQGKVRREVMEALEYLSGIHIRYNGGEGQVFGHHFEGKGKKRLWLSLQGPLEPRVREVSAGKRRRAHLKALVPYPERLPPLVGKAGVWAAQADAQSHLMVFMRKHAEELAKYSHVNISDADFRSIWSDAGVPRQMGSRVLEAWLGGQAELEAPPLLMRHSNGRYSLDPDGYAAEMTSILNAGKASLHKWRGPRNA